MINDKEMILDLDCGGLKIFQSTFGYKFTTDSILLSSIVKATEREKVLEMGSGSGIISLLLSHKTRAKEIIGIEIQKRLYELSKRSAELNNLSHRVQFMNVDIRKAHHVFSQGSFDVVVVNPPYNKVTSNKELSEINICKTEILCPLEHIFKAASKVLKYGGRFYTVIKSTRLTDVISEMRNHKIEPKVIIPVQPKKDKKIELFLIYGKHNAQSGLVVEKPLIVYNANNSYTPEMNQIYFGHSNKNRIEDS